MAVPQGYLIVPVGFNPSGDMRALELDADDALKVALSEAAKGLVGMHGWIGGAWQKQPIIFGYSGLGGGTLEDASASTTGFSLFSDYVPDGEVWQVFAASVRNCTSGGAVCNLSAPPTGPGVLMVFDMSAANRWYTYDGPMVYVGPGQQLRFAFEGVTVGDRILARFSYVRLDIDQ